jgi:hypothetical protein
MLTLAAGRRTTFVCTCQPFCQICQVGEFEGEYFVGRENNVPPGNDVVDCRVALTLTRPEG